MSFTVLVIWFPRICIKLKLKVYLCECKEYLCISDFKGSQLVDMSLLWHITCWSSCQTTAPCNWVSLTGDLENMGQSLCKFLSWHWLLYLYVKFQQFSIIGRIMKTTLSKATLRKFWVSDQVKYWFFIFFGQKVRATLLPFGEGYPIFITVYLVRDIQ